MWRLHFKCWESTWVFWKLSFLWWSTKTYKKSLLHMTSHGKASPESLARFGFYNCPISRDSMRFWDEMSSRIFKKGSRVNRFDSFLRNVINRPCPYFDSGLSDPPPVLGNDWVITTTILFHCKKYLSMLLNNNRDVHKYIATQYNNEMRKNISSNGTNQIHWVPKL